ncbi:hypothetical protein ACQW02_25545 [Humitalea sp. 24SJ18S-53]|uniref:hypothetical protein n=1 Tax=Humitalea sp. 24SJ18S-53 TaxID=3422307 RepID=UPI003D66BF3B
MYARIVDGLVAEIIPATDTPIADRFHADVVATLVAAAAGVAPGWSYTGSVFAEPPPPAPPPAIRVIAPLAWRRRLGSKRRAITLAASADLEAGDPTIQVMIDDVAASRLINLDDPDLAAGVALLAARGHITEGEASALLADGTSDELPD